MSNAQNSEAVSATTSSFVTSLVSNIAIAGAEVAAFMIIHGQFRAIYEPRSYMPLDPRRKVRRLGRNVIKVFWFIWLADPKEALEKNGTDAYVFLRFLRMMLKILIPIWLLSWIVLLPVDAAGTNYEGKGGLDRLTFGNIAPNATARYAASLIFAYLFTFWIFYNIYVEMRKWVSIRQSHLINPEHSRLAQANTVLITGIDKRYLDEERLAQLFSHLPGGVKKIWLNRNLKEMVGIHEARVSAVKKLESAQVSLVKQARKLRVQVEKKQAKGKKESSVEKLKPDQEIVQGEKPSPSLQTLQEVGADKAEVILADRLVPRAKRPTHRLPGKRLPFALPWTGTKVDTIDWCRKEIVRTSALLERSRQTLRDDIDKPGVEGETYPPLNSAFIYFNQQIAAHMAAQIRLHDQPYKMHETYLEMSPQEVIWSNLSLNPYEKNVRLAISWAITGGLILLWTFPTAFIGAMSNASQLCLQYTWMSWLCRANNVAQGLFSGVLPPILLALLNLLLPVILTQLARFEGIPQKTGLDLSLMTRYTIFLVVNSFLIVTIASGLISALPAIGKNPSSVATILATQLPKASTFFLTYVMLQAAGAAGNLLQIISLVIYIIKLILLGGTPRSVWGLRYNMQTPTWGQTFPNVTIVAIITISYMIISPIINGLAVAAFFMLYEIYKYLYIWVIDTPAESDTGGLFFPKAITHLFVGMYIQQVALCALFFLAQDQNGKQSAITEGALMVVLIVITVAFQYTLITSYSPLKRHLPLTLAHLSYGMPKEEGHEGSILEGEGSDAEFDPRAAANARRSIDDQPGSSNAFERPLGLPDAEEPKDDVEMANIAVRRLKEAGFRVQVPAEIEQGAMTTTATTKPTEVPHSDEAVNATDYATGVPPPQESPQSSDDTQGNSNNSSPEMDKASTVDTNQDMRREQVKRHDDFEADAFSHPATKEDQRIIWLPVDELGLGQAEVDDNNSVGIVSSTKDAVLTSKGSVNITGPPPDVDREM